MNQRKTEFKDKWTPRISGFGFTELPNILIHNQGKLDISSGELVTLLGLISHRWDNRYPNPSVARLAKFSGRSLSSIRSNLRSLEAKKYIKRIYTYGFQNHYDITLLIRRLERSDLTIHTSIKKLIPPSQFINSPPRRKLDTKEDEVKRRLSKNSGFQSISDTLKAKKYN